MSLPRSLSSKIYQISYKAIGLKTPQWSSSGEILNPERFLFNNQKKNCDTEFSRKESNIHIFNACSNFLHDVVKTKGYCYKDVIQPFIISDYLNQLSINTIYIRRYVSDVVLAMEGRNWTYPINASNVTQSRTNLQHMVDGLVRAQTKLEGINNKLTLNYDDIIFDEAPLKQALHHLYPQIDLSYISYIDSDFIAYREAVLQRRDTEEYKEISKYIADSYSAFI